MPEAVIAQNISKCFGQRKAIEALNLNVVNSEIMGLIGPDGAGKTTTLRVLATVLPPTEGQVIIAGLDAYRYTDRVRQKIGYMAQQFNLYSDLSVEENLVFFADIFGLNRQDRLTRIDKLLNLVQLSDFKHRRAGHLSGGMKRKLALACCLVHEPEVLFLDEPTIGVDPVSRREFWDILTQLHLQGVTIIISTPYMDEAERCSRVGLLHTGRIIACEKPQTLKTIAAGQVLELRLAAGADSKLAISQAIILLKALPGVIDTTMYGDILHIMLDQIDVRLPQITHTLMDTGLTVVKYEQVTPRMEEAFTIWLSRQMN